MLKVTDYKVHGDTLIVNTVEVKTEYITVRKVKEYFAKNKESFGITNTHSLRNKRILKELIEEMQPNPQFKAFPSKINEQLKQESKTI